MVKPFRIVLPKLHAERVIELPAHTIFRSRTEEGDELVIDRYEARKIPKPGEVEIVNAPVRQERQQEQQGG